MARSNCLSYHGALSAGAQLWALPGPLHSLWNIQTDWYLHFQLKTLRQEVFEAMPAQLSDVKYFLDGWLFKTQPLLVESSQFLPNLLTLELAYSDEWVQGLYRIWSRLNRPILRAFIPRPLTEQKWLSQWRGLAGYDPEQYVMEPK